MKRFAIITALLLGTAAIAQPPGRQGGERHQKAEMIKDMTAEQLAELRTKEMTLHLDLDENQQSRIYQLNLQLAEQRKSEMEKREGKEKPTAQEMYEHRIAMLDQQIEMKKQLKEVLTQEQFAKLELQHEKRRGRRKGPGKGGQRFR